MDQLAERSLPTPQDLRVESSHREKDQNNEKEAGNDPFLRDLLFSKIIK